MKFLLMMHAPGQKAYEYTSWPEHAWAAHLAFLTQLNSELTAAGELVAIMALQSPDHARRVRAGHDRLPITDGVFPESKEFLAGFWVIEVSSVERACEIAARASLAPGPDGAPLHMSIEVREVLG